MQTVVANFSYENAFNCLFRHLEILASEAQKQKVNLALENPSRDLLLSPLELRDLIDQINSAHLGICFNPHYAAQLGKPLDWAHILNHRIFAVKLAREKNEEQIPKDILSYLNILMTEIILIHQHT
jgi:hexulose-6-phosphate isomerase